MAGISGLFPLPAASLRGLSTWYFRWGSQTLTGQLRPPGSMNSGASGLSQEFGRDRARLHSRGDHTLLARQKAIRPLRQRTSQGTKAGKRGSSEATNGTGERSTCVGEIFTKQKEAGETGVLP